MLTSLIKISLGQIDGVEYVAKQFNLSANGVSICKGICSNEASKMEPMFQALMYYIPFDLSR